MKVADLIGSRREVFSISETSSVSVTPEMTMEDCLRLMEQNTIFHLIVLDEKLGFRGMLSISDILKVVALDEKARADLLESFIFPQR